MIENILARENEMILADEVALKEVGIYQWDCLMIMVSIRFYQTVSTHCLWAGQLDEDHDIEMEEATPNKSDLSESDADTCPGSK